MAAEMGCIDACIDAGVPYPMFKTRLEKIVSTCAGAPIDDFYTPWLLLQKFVRKFVARTQASDSVTNSEMDCYVGWLFRPAVYESKFGHYMTTPEWDCDMRCVDIYHECCDHTRSTIMFSTFALRQMGLVKDVRQIIMKLVWESRISDYVAFKTARIYKEMNI